MPTENFTRWLVSFRKALRDNNGIDVPCGDCRACCTAGYFIHIHHDEKETLTAIGPDFLSDASGAPPGTRRLDFNDKGHCPLLQNDRCMVYENRPWTCRIYDCRLLTAAGLFESDDKPEINQQVKGWRFTFDDDGDYDNSEAVKKAARFIAGHRNEFPPGYVSERPVQQAAAAVKVFELFLSINNERVEELKDSLIADVVKAVKEFDA